MKKPLHNIAFFAFVIISIGCSASSINYGFVAREIFGIAVGIANLVSVGYVVYRYMKNIMNK